MSGNLPSLDLAELRYVIGGAERATRRANVAQALQSLKNTGSVANWVDRTMSTKHGMVNCACGCGLPNCR